MIDVDGLLVWAELVCMADDEAGTIGGLVHDDSMKLTILTGTIDVNCLFIWAQLVCVAENKAGSAQLACMLQKKHQIYTKQVHISQIYT